MQKRHEVLVVVHSLRHVQLLENAWTAARQASLSFTISQSLLKLMYTELMMHPTISSSVVPFSCPQSILASGSFPMRKGSLHQVAKVLELQLQHESFQ